MGKCELDMMNRFKIFPLKKCVHFPIKKLMDVYSGLGSIYVVLRNGIGLGVVHKMAIFPYVFV